MKRLALLLIACVLPLTSVGQLLSDNSKGPSVTAAPIAPVTVQKGKSAPVEMGFRVARGYHINSNKPSDEFLLPTQLKLDPPTDMLIKLEYPEGQDYSFAFAPDQKLNVYTGDFVVKGKVSTTTEASKGTYRVHGTLNYQACDNAACYPPRKLPVSFEVHVVSGPKKVSRNPRQSPHVH